jgi:predicted SAM-dependent methyltransferase
MLCIVLKSVIRKAINALGWDVHRVPKPMRRPKLVSPSFDRIHYGCGYVYLDGWLNVDIIEKGPPNYLYVNLVAIHPFPDNYFRFGFSEDFIEHIDQASSLLFLVEAYRTLKPGGVLRLCFPGLKGELREHFRGSDYAAFERGVLTSYATHGHVHYYSEESIEAVATHIGYTVEFVEAGRSRHKIFNNLNTRNHVTGVHIELTKNH